MRILQKCSIHKSTSATLRIPFGIRNTPQFGLPNWVYLTLKMTTFAKAMLSFSWWGKRISAWALVGDNPQHPLEAFRRLSKNPATLRPQSWKPVLLGQNGFQTKWWLMLRSFSHSPAQCFATGARPSWAWSLINLFYKISVIHDIIILWHQLMISMNKHETKKTLS